MFRFQWGLAFAVLCAGFIWGVASESFALAWWLSFGSGILALLFWVRTISDKREITLFIGIAGIGWCLGAWCYAAVQPSPQSVVHVADGKQHDLVGTVARMESRETGVHMVLDDVVVDGVPREDRVLVALPLFSDVSRGTRVQLTCPLKRPEAFSGFAYDRYLAAKDILARCTSRAQPFVLGHDTSWSMQALRVIDTLHVAAVQAIDVVLPDPHAQLLAGLLLGDDTFSEIWSERFLHTGTSHIVAASGSNVTLVVTLVLATMFGIGIPRRFATVFAFLGIGIFVLLAGAESAVVRAGIMASLVVMSRALGRASGVRNILLFTICLMLLHEPRLLRDDIGFQLSVLSTTGLLLLSQRFTKACAFLPTAFGLREGFATTLAATVATLPVTAVGMGQLSIMGPLVNLLVLPLLPLAMATGALSTIMGMVAPDFARVIAFVPWSILDVMLMVIRECAGVSWGYIAPGEVAGLLVGSSWFMVFGGSVAVVIFVMRLVYKHRRHRACKGSESVETSHASQRLLVAALFLALFVGAFAQHVYRDGWFSPSVKVWVFAIGQGDGMLIDTPEHDVVIDGGPTFLMREKVGTVLPWTQRSLNTLFITHPHADHLIGTVPLLEQYAVAQVAESDQGCTSRDCRTLAAARMRSGSTRITPHAGDVFTLAPGVTLRTVWPQHSYNNKKLDDPNDGSLVLLLETPYGSMLFTGDAGADEESAFLPLLPEHVDVLKVGHHGSRTSTSSAFVSSLRPSIAVISLGEENSFHHPHPETLETLAQFGITPWRTDLHGDIRIDFTSSGIGVSAWSL